MMSLEAVSEMANFLDPFTFFDPNRIPIQTNWQCGV